MSAEVKHVKPCKECPFRRKSTPGWCGGSEPEWYVESALADYTSYGLAPCHTTATPENMLGNAACAGALIFAANNCKDPRDRDRSDAVGMVAQSDDVFRTRQEFIDHHRGPKSIRSWEE